MKRPILSFIIPVPFVRMPTTKFMADLAIYKALRKEPIYDDRALRMYDAGADRC